MRQIGEERREARRTEGVTGRVKDWWIKAGEKGEKHKKEGEEEEWVGEEDGGVSLSGLSLAGPTSGIKSLNISENLASN